MEREGSQRWAGLWYGIAVLLALIAVDLVVGKSTVLIGSYAFSPLVPAVFGGRRSTLLVTALAILAAFVSRYWDDVAHLEFVIQVGSIVLVGSLAQRSARSRVQAQIGMQRLRILNEISAVANRSLSIDDTLRVVEETVVPGVADFYMIDRAYRNEEGEIALDRRSVAMIEPYNTTIGPRLASRVPSVPDEMIDHEATMLESESSVRLFATVTDERLRQISHSDEDLEFLRSLEMNSYMHVWLQSRGQFLGVLTMAVGWSGRRFTTDDTEFAEVLAGRIALALDNAGLFSDLRRVERRLDTAMSVLAEAVVIHERGGQLVFANPAASRLFGAEDPDLIISLGSDGIARWCNFYDESGMPVSYTEMRVLRAMDVSDEVPKIMRVVFKRDGREVWLRPRVRTVMGADQKPLFAVTALEDLTDIKRAEFEQTLLGRSGELFAASDDYEAILRLIAELTVPMLADCCAVDVIDVDGDWRRAAFVHRDPRKLDRDLLSSGSAIKVELRVGGRQVGLVTLANEAGHRGLTEADHKLAARVVERAGVAMEHARLTSQRAEIAASLQQGLIPPPLPEIPGWEIAALYRPAGEQNEVGGDFYEAFRVEGAWMIVIGDVTGRGARAASVTAQARYTMRTAGLLNPDPAAALATLNRALLARPDAPICTAAVVLLPDGEEVAEIYSAGHPPALLTGPDGVREVGLAGPMLGAFEGGDWPSVRVSLEGHERLVLHTDGVTESERQGHRFGDGRLRDCLRFPDRPGPLLTRIEYDLHRFVAGQLRDDVAVLAIGVDREEKLPESPDYDLVWGLYDALNRRDLEGLIAHTTPDVVLDVPTGRLAGHASPYQGHAGIRNYMADVVQTWEDLLVTPRSIGQWGSRVRVTGRLYSRSRVFGMKDVPMTWMWEVREGLICHGVAHAEVEAANSFTEDFTG